MVLYYVLAVEKGCYRSSVLIAFESRIQISSPRGISMSRLLMNACSFQKSTTTTTTTIYGQAIARTVTSFVGLHMKYTLNELHEMSLLGTTYSPSYKHSLRKSCSLRYCLQNETTQEALNHDVCWFCHKGEKRKNDSLQQPTMPLWVVSFSLCFIVCCPKGKMVLSWML